MNTMRNEVPSYQRLKEPQRKSQTDKLHLSPTAKYKAGRQFNYLADTIQRNVAFISYLHDLKDISDTDRETMLALNCDILSLIKDISLEIASSEPHAQKAQSAASDTKADGSIEPYINR